MKSDFDSIEPDKYYLHVYQTKIEYQKYDLRTLNSRRIAEDLKKRCGCRYWPRPTANRRSAIRTNKPDESSEQQTTKNNKTNNRSKVRNAEKSLYRSKYENESWKQNRSRYAGPHE